MRRFPGTCGRQEWGNDMNRRGCDLCLRVRSAPTSVSPFTLPMAQNEHESSVNRKSCDERAAQRALRELCCKIGEILNKTVQRKNYINQRHLDSDPSACNFSVLVNSGRTRYPSPSPPRILVT